MLKGKSYKGSMFRVSALALLIMTIALTSFVFAIDTATTSTGSIPSPTVVPQAEEYKPCPQGCACMTEAMAIERYGEGNYVQCARSPCGVEQVPSTGSTPGRTVFKYCYKQKCPVGCICMTDEKAKELGYKPCQDTRIPCGYDSNKRPLFCFTPPQTPICPTGCICLTEEEAKKRGYTRFCDDKKIECGKAATGAQKFCYSVPVRQCSEGCICMSKEEGASKNLLPCLDDNGEAVICGVINAESGIFKYCFKKPEDNACHFDYATEKCVGACMQGMICKLNTIKRDPTTGKITFAECACKRPA